MWPRSERAPRVWNVTHPPTVRVRVGDPVELKYRSADADTRRIMRAISELLPARAREPYEPTADELALTFPAGHAGDGSGEDDRRPGRD